MQRTDLQLLLRETPYLGYAYAYPHKTAYRPFPAPVSLQTLWEEGNRDALFLYLHIPFCEMRCGFCNLFTTANPKNDFTAVYLRALRRQAEQVRGAIGDSRFVRLAIGGGTPTFLSVPELESLFRLTRELFGVVPAAIPTSVETSPRTAEPEKLALLREQGVERISIGVQSFVETETASVGRAQKTVWVEDALQRIHNAGFPVLNLDLIYGLPEQTPETWLFSLRTALEFAPEELFLYPLYVRPLTGLGRKNKEWDDARLAFYRTGRDFLLSSGYTQTSMRMFQKNTREQGTGNREQEIAVHSWAGDRTSTPNAQRSTLALAYCCQDDGMVGLGCGARSYTKGSHYASEYAVGGNGVRRILADYVAKPAESFAFADYGFVLNAEEQQRRYLVQSLLQAAGLEFAAYRQRFGTEAGADFPELCELEANGLATQNVSHLTLTETGMERSDVLGPWLYSPAVRCLMENYELQ